jgi:hypothetical protein
MIVLGLPSRIDGIFVPAPSGSAIEMVNIDNPLDLEAALERDAASPQANELGERSRC